MRKKGLFRVLYESMFGSEHEHDWGPWTLETTKATRFYLVGQNSSNSYPVKWTTTYFYRRACSDPSCQLIEFVHEEKDGCRATANEDYADKDDE